MKELPIRKKNRLKGYDYSQVGSYFITICTFTREELLGQIVVGAIHESPVVLLSSMGNVVASVISVIPNCYPSIRIDKYVIMPNHLHMILTIQDERAIHESPLQKGKRSLISRVVGYIKMNVTKQIREQNTCIYAIWQRGYHDHIIRNQAEYRKIWQYIDENPMKWQDDCYYI